MLIIVAVVIVVVVVVVIVVVVIVIVKWTAVIIVGNYIWTAVDTVICRLYEPRQQQYRETRNQQCNQQRRPQSILNPDHLSDSLRPSVEKTLPGLRAGKNNTHCQ